MGNALGMHIANEVARAESDTQTLRSRGQGVLGLAGGLVAALAAILAFGASTASFSVNGTAAVVAATALSFFFLAAALVALMMRPREMQAPTVQSLRDAVDNDWDNPRVDETVALSDLIHLEGLRKANKKLANLLGLAVLAQVAGLLAVLALALVLLCSA